MNIECGGLFRTKHALDTHTWLIFKLSHKLWLAVNREVGKMICAGGCDCTENEGCLWTNNFFINNYQEGVLEKDQRRTPPPPALS